MKGPILVEHGKPHLGRFQEPLAEANMLDATTGCLGWMPRPLRHLRLKEWQAVQIGTPRFFMILALFDAKFMSIAQAKIYDRETGKKHFFEQTLPPWSFRNPRSLFSSSSRFKARGVEIRFENHLERDAITVHLHLEADDDRPSVDAVFKLHAESVDPLINAIPFENGRFMYSHKGLFPVSGAIRIGEYREQLEESNAFAFLDHHKGYYGREMAWDWVTGAKVVDGHAVGFNLTSNASINRERFNENGFWIDGALHALPAVNFSRVNADDGSWRILDRAGLVDLRFEIEAPTSLRMDFGVIESDYLGPFGRFEGKLESLDGEQIAVDGFFGMGEKFYLKA